MLESNLSLRHVAIYQLDFLHPIQHPLSLENTMITMKRNFNVTDQELTTVLNLTQVTDQNEATLDHSRYRYYIRSYTIEPHVLHNLAIRWLSFNLFPNAVNLWLNYLQEHPGRNFHFRYVGQVCSPFNKRHGNLLSIRTTLFVRQLFDCLKAITGVDWNTNDRYFYVNPYKLDCRFNFSAWKEVDERGQMLISFFGIDNLLNNQSGDFHAMNEPKQQAVKSFKFSFPQLDVPLKNKEGDILSNNVQAPIIPPFPLFRSPNFMYAQENVASASMSSTVRHQSTTGQYFSSVQERWVYK